MAITKRIVILEQAGTAYRYVLWADVPAPRQPFYAAKQATFVSAWKDASLADNTALQSGAVTERSDITTMGPGDNLATAMARLQAIWAAYQAEVTAANNWSRYGSFMDTNNSWTAGGVS